MIHASRAFTYQLHNEDNRKYMQYVDVTPKNAETIHLTNKDLWNGGLSIEDAVSSDSSFDIGAAIINKSTVVINNIYERFSEYDFTDAEVITYVGLQLADGTIEKLRKGTYAVDETSYNGDIITLSCLDNMRKFDKPYPESGLKYPATLNLIVRDACERCGVQLNTYTFPHSDFVVKERPNDEAITFREIISWAAQIAGCFCRCDVYGRLELKWYDQELLEMKSLDGGIFDEGNPYQTGDNADGGSFNPWNEGYDFDGGTFEELNNVHNIYSNYSIDLSTDDVVITGVKVLEKTKEENKEAISTYLSGSEGYVISIENNELIKGGTGKQVAGWLGQQLIGFRFRRASVSHASDPTIEAGDVGFLTDRRQHVYPIVISSTIFTTGGSQTTTSNAEAPARNSAARYSAETKNYVEYRKDIEKERTDREKALEELGERINNSSGLFTTEEVQPDGSTIFYMHDKPTLEESSIIWKMTAEAFAVSTNGGETYNAGLTVDGDLIARILTAVGVNADWVKTGALRIEKNGATMVNMDFDTGVVDMVVHSFSLSSGATIDSIARGIANSAVNSQTQEDILNKLTNNGEDNGIYLVDGKLYMAFSSMKGGAITLGRKDNVDGSLIILDQYGNQIGGWGEFGFFANNSYFEVSEYDPPYFRMPICEHAIYMNYGNAYDTSITQKSLAFNIEFHGSSTTNTKLSIGGGGTIRSHMDNIGVPIDLVEISSDKYDEDHFQFNVKANADIYGSLVLRNVKAVSSSSYNLVLDGITVAHTSSSSSRYKNVGRQMNTQDIEELYKIQPVWAKYKEGYLSEDDERYNTEFPMFIAEDIEEHAPLAVDHNENGEAENWNYRVMIPYMFQMIKTQKETIDSQKAEIESLTQRLERLESLILKGAE